jgi:hypothetical protein
LYSSTKADGRHIFLHKGFLGCITNILSFDSLQEAIIIDSMKITAVIPPHKPVIQHDTIQDAPTLRLHKIKCLLLCSFYSSL